MSDGAGRTIPGYPKPLVGIVSSVVVAVVAAIPFGLEGWLVGAIGDQIVRRMEGREEAEGDGEDGRTGGNGDQGRAGGDEGGDGDERRADEP